MRNALLHQQIVLNAVAPLSFITQNASEHAHRNSTLTIKQVLASHVPLVALSAQIPVHAHHVNRATSSDHLTICAIYATTTASLAPQPQQLAPHALDQSF